MHVIGPNVVTKENVYRMKTASLANVWPDLLGQNANKMLMVIIVLTKLNAAS